MPQRKDKKPLAAQRVEKRWWKKQTTLSKNHMLHVKCDEQLGGNILVPTFDYTYNAFRLDRDWKESIGTVRIDFPERLTREECKHIESVLIQKYKQLKEG